MAGDHLAYILEVLIGFSSGDCDGNYRGLIWWFFIHTLIGLAVWIEALSCKKKKILEEHCQSLYTEQNYKSNTPVFAPIFHFSQKAYFSQILFTNLC